MSSSTNGQTAAVPAPSQAGDVVGFLLEAASSPPASKGQVVTFGQVFRAGDVPAGSRMVARLPDGTTVPVQLDVSARHADGSARTAIVSMALPKNVTQGQPLAATLALAPAGTTAGASIDLAAALAGRQAAVDVTPSGGGQAWHADLSVLVRQALQDGTAQRWQSGPLAAQARISVGVPASAVGGVTSMRLVADVTVRADGTLWTDAWLRNDAAMQQGGGTASYSVRVALDGKELLRADGVNQVQYTGWGRLLSSAGTGKGAAAAQPTVRFDAGYLADAGAVARYDTSVGVGAALLSTLGSAAGQSSWSAPLGTRGVTQYMPNVGGRADIGPATEAQAALILTGGDPQAAAYAIGQAEAAGAVPWHLWDPKGGSAGTGGWMDAERWPKLWTDGRDTSPGAHLLQAIPTSSGWTLDPAHQPDLAYVPYLLTGRRAFLDEVQAQASWSVLAQWPDPRGGADGNVVNNNQVRGGAWSLRQLNEAAWTAPDGSADQAYLKSVAARNWSWVRSQLPAWTAQQGEAHGWIPGEYGTTAALPPWQQDYFASTAAEAARQGSADALEVLKWMSNFLVGRFLAAGKGFDPHDGAAYLIAIAPENRPDQPYKSWAEIEAATKARGMSNDGGWTKSEGDYAQLARQSLAAIIDLTGSDQAKQAYQWLNASGAPFIQAQDFAKDPTYDIVPRAGGTPVPAPTPAPTPAPAPPPAPAPAPVQTGSTGSAPSHTVTFVLSEDAWQGDAQAIFTLDGKQLGGVQAVTASHALGQSQRVTFSGTFGTGPHAATVEFLNDAWGGTASTDRNLYVDGIEYDGTPVANAKAALLRPEQAKLTIPAAQQQPATPSADTFVLRVSEDAWQGDAQYVVSIDGTQVGGVRTAGASHALGKSDAVTITGQFGTGAHSVAVSFLNDAWGGTAQTDRNLYVDGLSYNGTAVAGATASLLRPETAAFKVPSSQPPADSGLVLNISEDAWQGDAQFLVNVDGTQVGGVRTAGASHALGRSEAVRILGQFGPGPHDVAVSFLNDAWGGTAQTDRNLYVDSLDYGGKHVATAAALLRPETVHFTVPPLTTSG